VRGRGQEGRAIVSDIDNTTGHEPTPEPSQDDLPAPDRRLGRRSLLAGAAAAGAGAAVGLVAGTEPATAQTAAKTSKDVLLGEANTATATTSITMSASGDSAVAGVDTSPDGGYGVSGTSTNGTGVYGASASSGNTVGPGPAGVAGYGMTSDAIGVEAVNSSNGVALSVEGKATFSTSASDGLVVSMAPAMTGDPLQVENSSSESLLSLVPVNSGHDLTLQLGNSDGVTSVVLDPSPETVYGYRGVFNTETAGVGGLAVGGVTSQTADLVDFLVNNTVVAKVDAAGGVHPADATGSAGAAVWPPANVDYAGVVEATATLNTLIAAAAQESTETGRGVVIQLGTGVVKINQTVALSIIPSGVSIRGAGMGTAYDYSTVADPKGSFYSGTTLLDYGVNTPTIHIKDPNFPGPESSQTELGFTQSKSSGGKLESLTLFCMATTGDGGGKGLVGLFVDSIYNWGVVDVRICHYNDGSLMWNPLINFALDELCTFAGKQFGSRSADNLANLPPFTATSNSFWSYVGPTPVWNSALASIGLQVSPAFNREALGGGSEKNYGRNLIIQDCTRGFVMGPRGTASNSGEYGDWEITFLQGGSASWCEVTDATFQHNRLHFKGNSKQDVEGFATPAPLLAIGADGTSCGMENSELVISMEVNGPVGSPYSTKTTYVLGQVISSATGNTVLISLANANTGNPVPAAGSANAFWANLGDYGGPQTVRTGSSGGATSLVGAILISTDTAGPIASSIASGSKWVFYGPVVGDTTIPTSPIPGLVTPDLTGVHTLIPGETAIWTAGSVTAILPDLGGSAAVVNQGSGTITVAPPPGGILYSLTGATGNQVIASGTSGRWVSRDGASWYEVA
jgi:hypothetical protein